KEARLLDYQNVSDNLKVFFICQEKRKGYTGQGKNLKKPGGRREEERHDSGDDQGLVLDFRRRNGGQDPDPGDGLRDQVSGAKSTGRNRTGRIAQPWSGRLIGQLFIPGGTDQNHSDDCRSRVCRVCPLDFKARRRGGRNGNKDAVWTGSNSCAGFLPRRTWRQNPVDGNYTSGRCQFSPVDFGGNSYGDDRYRCFGDYGRQKAGRQDSGTWHQKSCRFGDRKSVGE